MFHSHEEITLCNLSAVGRCLCLACGTIHRTESIQHMPVWARYKNQVKYPVIQVPRLMQPVVKHCRTSIFGFGYHGLGAG
jgi:hypothetical protein